MRRAAPHRRRRWRLSAILASGSSGGRRRWSEQCSRCGPPGGRSVCDGRVSTSSPCNRPPRFAPSREAARVPTDDRELAHRFSSGDDESVRAVYERYGRAVHTVAYSIVHDASTAADVVQATFVKAWRAAGTFNPERDLGPWLYTIARRQAIDTLRRERRGEPAAQ